VNSYEEPVRRSRRGPRAAADGWGSEAPRGICWHHYDVDDHGKVEAAQIVAPRSDQMIEAIGRVAPQVLSLPHAEATIRRSS